MKRIKVAVVGGGIFGVTVAAELADEGHDVDLFEQHRDLLMAASGINQYRLHRGYHYPRSPETARAAKASETSFRSAYGPAVIDEYDHFYAIAKRDSLTSAQDFIRFCEAMGLEHKPATPPIVRPDAVALCVRVRESLFDPDTLRALCWDRLRRAGVRVHLGTRADPAALESYDFRVIAAYAAINTLLDGASDMRQPYQFEVCEKPVVRLPSVYRGHSVVVMDGPFMCVDPLGRSGLFVLGNVVHAIHHANTGLVPEVPPDLQPLIDAGVIPNLPVTKSPRFIDAAREFFADIERAEHVGSMFTVRAVLPGEDATDARPTLVRRTGERTVTVFSGKVGTCVEAARQVLHLLKSELGRAPLPQAQGAP